MTLLGAFLVGYWMGNRAGPDGTRKMFHVGMKIVQSEEFQSTVAGVAGMARGALAQALERREPSHGLRAA